MNDRHHRIATSRSLIGLLTTVLVITAVMASTPDDAVAAEGHVWGGVGAANVNHAAPTALGWWGPSLEAGAVIDVTDFWRIGFDLGASHHFQREIDDEPAGPHTVASVGLEARYAFDVFTYVPYAGLGMGFHPLGAPSQATAGGELLSLRATIGLDYRHSRSWSYGGALRLHAPISEPTAFPHYSSIRGHVAYHFRLF